MAQTRFLQRHDCPQNDTACPRISQSDTLVRPCIRKRRHCIATSSPRSSPASPFGPSAPRASPSRCPHWRRPCVIAGMHASMAPVRRRCPCQLRVRAARVCRSAPSNRRTQLRFGTCSIIRRRRLPRARTEPACSAASSLVWARSPQAPHQACPCPPPAGTRTSSRRGRSAFPVQASVIRRRWCDVRHLH